MRSTLHFDKIIGVTVFCRLGSMILNFLLCCMAFVVFVPVI
jgi:hypothetical protein